MGTSSPLPADSPLPAYARSLSTTSTPSTPSTPPHVLAAATTRRPCPTLTLTSLAARSSLLSPLPLQAAFPAVLDLLDLHAFDFAKVIESFVKTEPRLPHHLRAHFADVEAKILESLAW